MSGKKVEIVGWDTNIFLAWIKDEIEKHGAGVIDAIKIMVDKMEEKKLVIVTSVITLIEVLDSGLDNSQKEEFTRIQNIPFVQIMEVNFSIARLSHDLRDYYRKRGEKTLMVADAIHLATAVNAKVDSFYTLDEKDKGNQLGLIPLSGNLAGKHNLEILKPSTITKEHDLFNNL